MKKDRDTCKILLDCAKKEFLEKGFKTASLRNICKNANMTTGAVYFFYENKEGLFSAVVKPFVDSIYAILSEHMSQEKLELVSGEGVNENSDFEVAKAIAHAFYANKDVATILLEKSEGTEFENLPNQIIGMLEHESASYFSLAGANIDPWIIHWYAHIMWDSFMQTLLHFDSENEALPRLMAVVKILQNVWSNTIEI